MKKINALTWGGLLLAFHVIIVLIPRLIPGSELFLMLLAPLFSAMYVIRNKPREIWTFVIATLLVCLLIDTYSALLFILPVLFTGVCYGYLAKFEKDNVRTIYVLSFVQFGLFLLSAALVRVFYGVDVIAALMNLFRLDRPENQKFAVPLLMIYSIAEAILIHYVLKNEAKKFGIAFPKYDHPSLAFILISVVALVFAIIQPVDGPLNLACCLLFGYTMFPLVYYFILIYRERAQLLLAIACLSFLLFTIPLLKLLPTPKILLACWAVGTVYYVGGIIHFFKSNYFKKYLG